MIVKDFIEEDFTGESFENITTFEDACLRLNIASGSVLKSQLTPSEISERKLKIVIRAINQGWVPDWKSGVQSKWYPIFDLSSRFYFSRSHCHYPFTESQVGSDYCFESESKSDYTAKQFIDLYREVITTSK